MFLYKNLNTGDYSIYSKKQDLDLNIFMFVREIKEVKLFSVPCYLVSEDGAHVRFLAARPSAMIF